MHRHGRSKFSVLQLVACRACKIINVVPHPTWEYINSRVIRSKSCSNIQSMWFGNLLEPRAIYLLSQRLVTSRRLATGCVRNPRYRSFLPPERCRFLKQNGSAFAYFKCAQNIISGFDVLLQLFKYHETKRGDERGLTVKLGCKEIWAKCIEMCWI